MMNCFCLIVLSVLSLFALPLRAIGSQGIWHVTEDGGSDSDWQLFLSQQPDMTVGNSHDSLVGYPDDSRWKGLPLLSDGEMQAAASAGKRWNDNGGSVGNTFRAIPSGLVGKYVIPGSGVMNDRRGKFYYGGKKRLVGGDVANIVYHWLPGFRTSFGKGVTEVLFMVHSSRGAIMARHVVGVERNNVPLRIRLSLDNVSLYDSSEINGGVQKKTGSFTEFRIAVSDTLMVADVRNDTVVWGRESYYFTVNPASYKLTLCGSVSGSMMPRKSVVGQRGLCHERNVAVAVSDSRREAFRRCDGNVAMLDDAYHALVASPDDSVLQRRFFDMFPGDNNEFADAYRLRIGKECGQHLFLEANRQALLFATLRGKIPDSLYVKKFIQLYNGLQSDFICEKVHSILTYGVLREVFCFCGDELFSQLSKMSHQKQFGFWRTAFTGSIFDIMWIDDESMAVYLDKDALGRVNRLRAAYPAEYGVIEEAKRLTVDSVSRINYLIGGV